MVAAVLHCALLLPASPLLKAPNHRRRSPRGVPRTFTRTHTPSTYKNDDKESYVFCVCFDAADDDDDDDDDGGAVFSRQTWVNGVV